ncbi:hypothetical protein B0H11DRAFT_277775 [Mycena galericulata]|nr:hypothetical protein B0H11DRAFT_277775 [Mycena galericulata]
MTPMSSYLDGLTHSQLNDEARNRTFLNYTIVKRYQGRKFFQAKDFRGAALCYELATKATDQVPIYFTNLAAAYLKLGRYPLAHIASTNALNLEPRALKPRYRRAIARKFLKRIPEALVDILSLLTTDPNNAEGRAEFQILVDLQNTPERRPLSPEDIIDADLPHAHGSSDNPRRENYMDRHQKQLPFFRVVPWEPHTLSEEANPLNAVSGACHACKTPHKMKDLKTCRKCRRVNYCSTKCQRAEWPDHKLTCKVAVDDNKTIHIGRNLADHQYFHTHLMLYAIRALGPAKPPQEEHDLILMVVIDMVPMLAPGPKPNGKMHIVIKNIVPVPTCIVPEEVAYIQRANLKNLMAELNPSHSVWITTTGIYPEGEDCRFRLNCIVAAEIIASSAHLPGFSLDLYSRSHGLYRRINMDLDFLFESMNDELRLDVDNYYQMQR